MRVLSPDSARVASDLLDMNLPAEQVTPTVNHMRTELGQSELHATGHAASGWRRDYHPQNPAPYQVEDIRALGQGPRSNSSGSMAPAGTAPVLLPRTLSPASVDYLRSLPNRYYAETASNQQKMVERLNQYRGTDYTLAEVRPVVQNLLESARPNLSSVANEALLRELIDRHNPQDFTGAPLPTGSSAASGSEHPSMFSQAGNQWAPPSVTSSLEHQGPLRTSGELRSNRVEPYSSRDSGSSSSTVKQFRCKHDPGGFVDTETFVGCNVTDDELKRRETKATKRVAKRRLRFKKAESRGLNSTGAVQRAEKDARAYLRGFASRHEAEKAARDNQAKERGFASRQQAARAEKDDRAYRKGFASRQQAVQAERDALAVRQLGPGATRLDLAKIQEGERKLASERGVDVSEIRRQRKNLASPQPSVAPSGGRPVVALSSLEDVKARSWNDGDRFTLPWQGGQTRLFEVKGNRLAGDKIVQGDIVEILRGG